MTNLQQGLLITLIGMGLVFVIIIFLWGLMALMMALTSGGKKVRQEAEAPSAASKPTDEALIPQMEMVENQRRAATAAVAVQLALNAAKSMRSQKTAQEEVAGVSPWQAFHRTRQLENRESRG